MLVLGLSNMRDAAAALVRDGEIIAAAEEERFVRRRHVTALPVHAIKYCLREANVSIEQLHAIAVPWKYWVLKRRAGLALSAMFRSPRLFWVKGRRTVERLGQEWRELFFLHRELGRRISGGGPRPVFLDHHLCHAASAFLVSPFERAAILVVDGASEADTTMMAEGTGSRFTVLQRTPLPHSLGQFYASITSHLGFKPDHDEYIVMGLAAYGEPVYAGPLRRHILRLLPEGRFELNTGLCDFHLARVGFFPREFVELFGNPRRPDEELTQRHRDLAASAQLVLEETLLHLGRHVRTLTDADALCLAGGVAYNCVANSRLRDELGFRHVFVQPAAGDSGAAAALRPMSPATPVAETAIPQVNLDISTSLRSLLQTMRKAQRRAFPALAGIRWSLDSDRAGATWSVRCSMTAAMAPCRLLPRACTMRQSAYDGGSVRFRASSTTLSNRLSSAWNSRPCTKRVDGLNRLIAAAIPTAR